MVRWRTLVGRLAAALVAVTAGSFVLAVPASARPAPEVTPNVVGGTLAAQGSSPSWSGSPWAVAARSTARAWC